MSDTVHVVLDTSAMVAAGRANLITSRLIHRAHTDPGWRMYVPVCALVEADRSRPRTAEHLAALPAVTVLDLDLPAALALAREDGWGTAHVLHAAMPTAERPDGAVVATAGPEQWRGRPVRVLSVLP